MTFKKVLFVMTYLSLIFAHKDSLTLRGRSVFIHLFEWKWTDIALECERYLGPNGYAAVQISAPNEHSLVYKPFRPWWERYQPVSYKLISRSGTEEELKDMVNRCNSVGVRIYVDSVINHMSATTGKGTAGTEAFPKIRNYPGVPYGPQDFNDNKCNSSNGLIENEKDPKQVRNCQDDSLPDLDHSRENVRQKIIDYMNKLINIGVAGFRIDAAKNMWPDHLLNIFSNLSNVRKDIFGSNKRPFIYQEVTDIDSGSIKSSEYTPFARVSESKYGIKLNDIISKRYDKKLADLKNMNYGLIEDGDAISSVDNYNNQRYGINGSEILTYKNPREYIIANAFMLAWPYGIVQIMSSYDFPKNDTSYSPPMDKNQNIKDVKIKEDGSCDNGWICEHRWKEIKNMVNFRYLSSGEMVKNWWDNGKDQIAFSRGDKAFIAINNQNSSMNVSLKTDLVAGKYCDVISGDKLNDSCTGKMVTVGNDQKVRINISNIDKCPIIAIHIESKI